MSEELYFERRRTTFDVSFTSNNQILQQKSQLSGENQASSQFYLRACATTTRRTFSKQLCVHFPLVYSFFLIQLFLINIVKSFCLYARCSFFFPFLFKCLQILLSHEVVISYIGVVNTATFLMLCPASFLLV